MITERINNIIKRVIKYRNGFVPLHNPVFEGNEEEYLVDCVRSNFVSSVGAYVDKFEEMLSEYTGVKRAVVAMNGTAALHICFLVVGVGPGDEILLPSLTFVATANAVSYSGATPHFVDVEKNTLGIDADKLDSYLSEISNIENGICYNKKTGKIIKAVLPMHTFGHPVDMDKLKVVADKYNLKIIEDAAESLGSFYKGKHTGNFGDVTALSFNGNKIITTGGGGAILTNDDYLADRAKYLTTTAKVPHKWEYFHDVVGYNYRMPALNAALGCAQMEQLEKFIKQKRDLAMRYAEAFDNLQGVSFFTEPEFAKSNYWLNTIILSDELVTLRDEILDYTNKNGIMTRPIWTPMHKLPMYKSCPKMDLSFTENIEKRIINIPSSAWLAENS